jgi:vacuolar-type H+-ATPase subunit F/Vma7
MGGGICAAVSEEIALGLSLAGVTDLFIHGRGTDDKEVRGWYLEKVKGGVGVMILTKEVGEILSRELFERRVAGEMIPVTVIIPGDDEDKRAADLIKRAIGMDPTRTAI